MENMKQFWEQYKGAIVGGLIGLLILCTNLYRLVIGIILIAIGIYIGNYVQYNKSSVKERLKKLIDKM
ncbi:MAG: DUF2273 domain-containing protein [Clostridia bacterium]|nr:DUF2273 domain-containing protein [Clostridia bacterium]